MDCCLFVIGLNIAFNKQFTPTKTEIGMDILFANEFISLTFEDRFLFVSQKQVYLFV
jgi:hypothetical protein